MKDRLNWRYVWTWTGMVWVVVFVPLTLISSGRFRNMEDLMERLAAGALVSAPIATLIGAAAFVVTLLIALSRRSR